MSIAVLIVTSPIFAFLIYTIINGGRFSTPGVARGSVTVEPYHPFFICMLLVWVIALRKWMLPLVFLPFRLAITLPLALFKVLFKSAFNTVKSVSRTFFTLVRMLFVNEKLIEKRKREIPFHRKIPLSEQLYSWADIYQSQRPMLVFHAIDRNDSQSWLYALDWSSLSALLDSSLDKSSDSLLGPSLDFPLGSSLDFSSGKPNNKAVNKNKVGIHRIAESRLLLQDGERFLGFYPSHNGRYLAYYVDTQTKNDTLVDDDAALENSSRFELRLFDISTQEYKQVAYSSLMPSKSMSSPSLVHWSANNDAIYFAKDQGLSVYRLASDVLEDIELLCHIAYIDNIYPLSEDTLLIQSGNRFVKHFVKYYLTESTCLKNVSFENAFLKDISKNTQPTMLTLDGRLLAFRDNRGWGIRQPKWGFYKYKDNNITELDTRETFLNPVLSTPFLDPFKNILLESNTGFGIRIFEHSFDKVLVKAEKGKEPVYALLDEGLELGPIHGLTMIHYPNREQASHNYKK
ncbi:hypothetical protein CBF23_005935 [Marinomonas agarivorans]|nr:hypothetical protein CBF23_005935 [Marinomonas agarivorans]